MLGAMSDELRAAIGVALRALSDGEGATIKAIRAQRVLVTLECAIAEATGGGRTSAQLDEISAAVVRFLGEAADALEGDPTDSPAQKAATAAVPNYAKAARAALGLKPELSGRPWEAARGRPGRQIQTAEWLGKDKENLDKPRADGSTPRGELLERVTEQLAQRDSLFTAETRRLAQRARRPPLESAMRVEWLSRFERYYKIWGSLAGLRNDLEMGIHHQQRQEVSDADWFIRKSLYYYASFLADLRQFTSQHGGLWVLPDTRTEDAIADAMWFVRKPMPSTEVSDSILQICFAGAAEIAPFMHETFANRTLHVIVADWHQWVISCRCKRPRQPRKDCGVHCSIEWVRFYMEAVDSSGTSSQIGTLCRVLAVR
jgi:hypothetical protein